MLALENYLTPKRKMDQYKRRKRRWRSAAHQILYVHTSGGLFNKNGRKMGDDRFSENLFVRWHSESLLWLIRTRGTNNRNLESLH